MSGPIRFEIKTESRSDTAYRTIQLLDNAPQYSYERSGSWRDRTPKTITWQVDRVTLHWRNGQLTRVSVKGYRLKKDGTVGLVEDDADFRPVKGDPSRLQGHNWRDDNPRAYEWDWLNTLVAENITPPPFDAE